MFFALPRTALWRIPSGCAGRGTIARPRGSYDLSRVVISKAEHFTGGDQLKTKFACLFSRR